MAVIDGYDGFDGYNRGSIEIPDRGGMAVIDGFDGYDGYICSPSEIPDSDWTADLTGMMVMTGMMGTYAVPVKFLTAAGWQI
jgi:hypothetical protein